MPPLAIALTLPFELEHVVPLLLALAVKSVGCATVTVTVDAQLFASVTITV